MRSFIPLSLVLLLDLQLSEAVKFPFRVRYTHASLTRRANSSSINVANTFNAEYISNITLGGRTIPVLLDTGSSDLWVTGDVLNTVDTGKSEKLSYAVGTAAGDINTVNLEFGGYTVQKQAYLRVIDTSTFSVDIQAAGYSGLIGLGPNTGSKIRDKIGDASGDSVLNRIFTENQFESNYVTILLNRYNDPAEKGLTSQMTISEVLPAYQNVTSMPKLGVSKVHKLTDADQHWQVFTDANGVLGPDGNAIKSDSFFPSAPNDALVAVIDSGYTLPQVPRKMSDAIYGRVPGANYDETQGYWTVPCDSLVNLTFVFGGVQVPVHPLDVVMSEFGYKDATGKAACVGSFQPITSAFSLLGEYDIVLGMAFLRNTYTYIDFGSFVRGSKSNYDPFVRLLPTTDREAAHRDFVNVRMGGVDVSGDSAHALLPQSQAKSSPESSKEKKQHLQAEILSRWPYIFVGCFLFVLILVGLAIWHCCKRRKAARAKQMNKELGLMDNSNKSTSYLPIDEPHSAMPVMMQTFSSHGQEHDHFRR